MKGDRSQKSRHFARSVSVFSQGEVLRTPGPNPLFVYRLERETEEEGQGHHSRYPRGVEGESEKLVSELSVVWLHDDIF